MSLFLGLQNAERLPPIVAEELEQLMGAIQTAFNSTQSDSSKGVSGDWKITGVLVVESSPLTVKGAAKEDAEIVLWPNVGLHSSGTVSSEYGPWRIIADYAASGPLVLAKGDPVARASTKLTFTPSYSSPTATAATLAISTGGTAVSLQWHAELTRLVFNGGATEVARIGRGSTGNDVAVNLAHVAGGAFGTGAVTGGHVRADANTSGNGAAATIRLQGRNATLYHLWVDDAGKLRIHTAAPTEDNATVADTAGTIVGTQV